MEEIEKSWRCIHIWAFIVIAIIMVGLGVFGYIVGYSVGRDSIITTIPETEVVETTVETTEYTTAPDETVVEDIVPTTEENIHIESSEMPSEALSASVSDDNVLEVSMDDRELLACVIYQEVGGDATCDDCRRRVADVVLNRVSSPKFPNTIYDVLMQPGQYGRFSWTGVKWPSRATNPGEQHAVERAYRIADEVLAGQHSELYGNGYVWQAGFVQGTDGFWCCGHFFGR